MNITREWRRLSKASATALATAGLAFVALVVVACGGAVSTPSGSAAASSPASAVPGSPPGTVVPTPERTPEPTTEATAEPTTEVTAEPTLEPPPAAVLVVAGVKHPGEVGSYVWAGGSDSAPWLPAAALETAPVAGGARAEVRLEPAVDISTWTARIAPADDAAGDDAEPLGSGAGRPGFELPSAGAWVVSVRATFADGLGDATWYWHVVIG